MNAKKWLALGAGALVGNLATDMFVIKSADGKSGFIAATPGLGMDDFVRALVIAGSIILVSRFIPHD